ncbi:35472_t:CDS:2, partial [Racocetra persica]
KVETFEQFKLYVPDSGSKDFLTKDEQLTHLCSFVERYFLEFSLDDDCQSGRRHLQELFVFGEREKGLVRIQESVKVCERSGDKENKGKTRKGITLLDIRKGKVGNGIFSRNKNLVEDLKLEGFTNLCKLIISSHQLISLDISDCSNLEELDCHGNELTTLRVDGCSNLKKIDCSNNPLRELDLVTCPSLEEVNINNCLKLTEETIKANLTYDTEKGKLSKEEKEKSLAKATTNLEREKLASEIKENKEK